MRMCLCDAVLPSLCTRPKKNTELSSLNTETQIACHINIFLFKKKSSSNHRTRNHTQIHSHCSLFLAFSDFMFFGRLCLSLFSPLSLFTQTVSCRCRRHVFYFHSFFLLLFFQKNINVHKPRERDTNTDRAMRHSDECVLVCDTATTARCKNYSMENISWCLSLSLSPPRNPSRPSLSSLLLCHRQLCVYVYMIFYAACGLDIIFHPHFGVFSRSRCIHNFFLPNTSLRLLPR